MKSQKMVWLVLIGFFFLFCSVTAFGTTPVGNISNVTVYESVGAIGAGGNWDCNVSAGSLKCENVDIDGVNGSCGSLNPDNNYRFDIRVENTVSANYRITDFDWQDVVGSTEAMGNIVAGDVNCMCDDGGSDNFGTAAVASGEIQCSFTGGNRCAPNNDWVVFCIGVDIASDASSDSDNLNDYFVSDGTVTDQSGSLNITIIPEYDFLTGSFTIFLTLIGFFAIRRKTF